MRAEFEPPGHKLRVMLVDDHVFWRRGVQQIVDAEDDMSVVAEASNGQEAITRALAAQPDLILMDVVMPKMDGFEAVKRLREHQQMRAVPVVMVTSKAEAESMEAGYQSGCNDYIIKPIDRFELLTKVKNLLGE